MSMRHVSCSLSIRYVMTYHIITRWVSVMMIRVMRMIWYAWTDRYARHFMIS
jgi:hypothetical protein